MSMSPEFKEHLLDLLSPMGPVQAKRMFGGGGLFLDGTMFGLVADDVLYLKADDENRADFDAAGAPPFTYQRQGRTLALGYFQAPDDIMDDAEVLAEWCRKAWEAGRRSGTKTKRRRKKSTRERGAA